MLDLKYQSFDLAFEYPFRTFKGLKTSQPTLVVSLGLQNTYGVGEAPAISYYDVTVEKMVAELQLRSASIGRYALTDPVRFWHFLHHLMPGQNFLIAALDIAGWDLAARLRRKPVYALAGITMGNIPATDYTIGMDTMENMTHRLKLKPMPVYKIKVGQPEDIDILRQLRTLTDAPFRIDANEGWTFEAVKNFLPDLKELGVMLIEQPLPKNNLDEMKELKRLSDIPLFADESCVEQKDVAACAACFHGINIKLTKCGGITPALEMIKEARHLGMQIMIGSMNESSVGTAAIAHLLPLADYADADGPLLLKEDVATGLNYENGKIAIEGAYGLGVKFVGKYGRA